MRYLTLTLLLLLLTVSGLAAELRGFACHIVDGDTFDLCEGPDLVHRIRLSGVDAPERGQAFYAEAKEALASQIEGDFVIVVWSKRDVYKRILGTVLSGSVNVNLELARIGAAWFSIRYSVDQPEIERLLYRAAEDEARAGKRGLWKIDNPVPPWAWRKRKRA